MKHVRDLALIGLVILGGVVLARTMLAWAVKKGGGRLEKFR